MEKSEKWKKGNNFKSTFHYFNNFTILGVSKFFWGEKLDERKRFESVRQNS